MNGGMPTPITIAPENAPTAPHMAIPAPEPAINIVTLASVPPPKSRIRMPATTDDRAIRLPTDKSMPPAMITKVIPTAMIAITAIWLATFSRLSVRRNVGQV